MSNIYNRKRNNFDLELNNDEYIDFCIDNDMNNNSDNEENCLITEIDINDSECVWFDKIFSKPNVIWDKSYNKGLNLQNIGLTGVDNGLINYNKEEITNENFLDLFFNSEYKIEKDDLRLTLNKIYGNNKIYDYTNNIVFDNNINILKLNGGFYQGFWKHECDYQVLPYIYENGMDFEIELKKSDFISNGYTLNDKHPENKGIFLYLGTRAENKWVKYYDSYKGEDCLNNYFDNDYIKNYYHEDLNEKYIKPIRDLYVYGEYVSDDYLNEECELCSNNSKYTDDKYIKNDYVQKDQPILCDNYFQDDYLKKDIDIDLNKDYTTKEELSLKKANYYELITDNKFILFNHTKDGYDVNTWKEGSICIINDIKIPNDENGFLLFNHTKEGYTTETIKNYIDKKSQKYDLFSDLYYNCIGFQITDEGEIGFKYLVKDCKEDTKYSILKQFSLKNIINNDEWYNIHIRIIPSKKQNTYNENITCKILIYVNKKLVLVSDDIKLPNFRPLKEIKYKQEGVPFNISLGGGTQGLCDVIYLNYRELPDKIYPIEKEFAGTFIGYIKKFKIFNCNLSYNKIKDHVF